MEIFPQVGNGSFHILRFARAKGNAVPRRFAVRLKIDEEHAVPFRIQELARLSISTRLLRIE